jgi:exopolyphosphatase/guanosine-5'-triphosphate,3'-diphosphate pyrophosphatase
MRVVRLGEGVDRTGRLATAALERTRAALVDYAQLIASTGAQGVRMVATSATRDAANRDEFVAMVTAVLGVEPEVITGVEEARLSFDGAVASLPPVPGPVLVTDIGGGSTELIRGGGGEDLRSFSMDIGCVRMTERHLHDDPPTDAQIAATIDDIRSALDRARQDVRLDSEASLVGVAGTVTTVAAIALELPAYEPDAIHGSVIDLDQVEAVTERLLRMSRAERAALPVMHPGRVDVIGGGALVLRTLMREAGAPRVVASEHDILDGIVQSVLRRSTG